MAVISLELTQAESDIVTFLTDYYERDEASLIKHSLKELYEDIIDKQIINEFERDEKVREVKFLTASQI
ncbi:MAG: hypothetical protein LBC70_00450 [Chitinispirillales bacterium]|jgi:hypothetical protein|nr:hypothetical protein [Chitinispirillales bacterium]